MSSRSITIAVCALLLICMSSVHQTSASCCARPPKKFVIEYFFKCNWHRAAQFCRYHGMQLASLTSTAEVAALQAMRTELGILPERLWISGNAFLSDRQFTWASNGRPFAFTNWWDGQPSNSNNGEECVEVLSYRDTWNDNACNELSYFVCETGGGQ